MCKGLLGKKIGMTTVFSPDGRMIPVTVVQAGPCVVTQVKTLTTDGYNALQLGFGEKKESRINKPMKGHLNRSSAKSASLKEFPVDNPEDFSPGQIIGTDLFYVGERVEVIGKTKGRGFSGVIKRHGFGGGRETHGGKCHRIPGSIGCSAWPSRVVKGKRLPGQYGNDTKTIKGLEIIDIRPDENLILIKGALPGATNGLVEIRKPKFLKK